MLYVECVDGFGPSVAGTSLAMNAFIAYGSSSQPIPVWVTGVIGLIAIIIAAAKYYSRRR